MNFNDFNFNEKTLLDNILRQGYSEPTDIQREAIPLLLNHNTDFIGKAQTGTGKTAAFLLPLIDRIDTKNKNIQALVLSPTRELANQIYEEFLKFSDDLRVKAEVVYGGTSYDRQIRGIKKNRPQIIIGTPGRVIDLMKQGVLRFDATEFLVLDEADEMLNMGFFEDVQLVIESLSDFRKIWMFSATMPRSIKNLIDKEFNDPQTVSIDKKTMTNSDIEQSAYLVKRKYFGEAISRLLNVEEDHYAIIFCRTKLDTADLANELQGRGVKADMLHGDMGQAQRDAAMARFKKKRTRVLVCTDVAARGIDVNNLTHVFNHDLPQDSESYVHRIGRTGRAGMKGKAVTIIDGRSVGRLKWIEKKTRQEIEIKKLPTEEQLKKALIDSKMENLNGAIEAIVSKGEEFRIDESFSEFSKYFTDLDRDSLEKLFFTYLFNNDFRRLRDLDNIEDEDPKRRRDRGYREVRSGDRNDRGGRRGDRRDRDDRRGSRDDRGDRRGSRRGDRGDDRFDRRDRRENRRDHSTKNGDIRVFMNMGKQDGLGLHLLLGQIAQQTGVKRDQINNVQLKDRFSFFDIGPKYGNELVKKRDIVINDQQVRFEVAKS